MDIIQPVNNHYDIIITGAGPAGLFCAINASSSGRSVLLLEKNSGAGKKLLLSGSGQCNFTHAGSVADFTRHYGETGNFVKPSLSAFSSADLIEFMESNGIQTLTRDDGKVFPASMNARDILDLMLRLCRENNVTIKYSSPVTDVSVSGGEFSVTVSDTVYHSGALVISAGGASYPATGSDGSGFTLAQRLGHAVTKITPALTPVFVRDFPLAEHSGISVKGSRVILLRDEKKFKSSTGDLLFTGKGLSGPVILDMSRYIKSGDIIMISFTDKSAEDINSALTKLLRSEGKKSVKSIIHLLDIPERLADAITEHAGIDSQKKGAEVTRSERAELLSCINAFPFTVLDKGDFRIAMATAGGVCRDEIDRRTMESKIVKNLYFAGEVIDVDGDTGGYNIQWAFSSGKAAAEGIKKIFP